MPREVLISQVDTLRDTYSGRQKAVAVLQAALKAVVNALSKAQRALRDFESQNVGVEVGEAQKAFAGSRLRDDAIDPLVPALRRETKNLTAITGALKDTSAALRSEPVDVVRLDKALTLLQNSGSADVAGLLPELREELDLSSRGLADEFGQKLRDALAKQGLAIGGRAPRFELGRFELQANFSKRIAVLRYGKDIVVPRMPVTVDGAIEAYNGAAKLITGRNIDGTAWMAQFYDAFRNAQRKRDTQSARVNIVECYVELVLLRQGRTFSSEPSKRTFTDYTRAQFAYDFYEFAERQHLVHNGHVVKAHVATKSQTDRPTSSMWIVEGDSPYDGRYFADVEFVKE